MGGNGTWWYGSLSTSLEWDVEVALEDALSEAEVMQVSSSSNRTMMSPLTME